MIGRRQEGVCRAEVEGYRYHVGLTVNFEFEVVWTYQNQKDQILTLIELVQLAFSSNKFLHNLIDIHLPVQQLLRQLEYELHVEVYINLTNSYRKVKEHHYIYYSFWRHVESEEVWKVRGAVDAQRKDPKGACASDGIINLWS